MTGSEIRVEGNCLPEKALCDLVFLFPVLVEMPQAALIGFPTIKPFRRLSQHALLLGLGQRWLDDPRDAGGNLVLHGEDVAEIAVVAIGPDMGSGNRIDQLR